MSFYILGRKYNLTVDDIRISKNTAKPSRPSAPLDHFTCSTNPPESYKCYYCDYQTRYKLNFNKHVEATKPSPSPRYQGHIGGHVCRKCSFATHSLLILLRHICDRGHAVLSGRPEPPERPRDDQSGRRIFSCAQCPYKSPHKYWYKRHIVALHIKDEDVLEWYECDQCTYKSKLVSNLRRHKRSRHSAPHEKTWLECGQCAYRSVWKKNLVQHRRVVHEQDGVRWHECDKCPHRTKSSSHLRRHVTEQHSEDFKWLECDKCPYRARQKIHMKLHTVQRHTPDDQIEWFECEQCPYRAKIKASLKNHVVKRHSKFEGLVCEKCGCEVGRRGLGRHLREKHGK